MHAFEMLKKDTQKITKMLNRISCPIYFVVLTLPFALLSSSCIRNDSTEYSLFLISLFCTHRRNPFWNSKFGISFQSVFACVEFDMVRMWNKRPMNGQKKTETEKTKKSREIEMSIQLNIKVFFLFSSSSLSTLNLLSFLISFFSSLSFLSLELRTISCRPITLTTMPCMRHGKHSNEAKEEKKINRRK